MTGSGLPWAGWPGRLGNTGEACLVVWLLAPQGKGKGLGRHAAHLPRALGSLPQRPTTSLWEKGTAFMVLPGSSLCTFWVTFFAEGEGRGPVC